MIRVGIDIGGTGIKVGLVNESIQIIREGTVPTVIDIPFEEQVKRIADCVLSTVSSAGLTPDDIESVGIGIPGIASSETGEIIKCTNMGWKHVPFRETFRKFLDKPVFIENDANVAALAESVAGISAGTSSSVFITIGTGIGSGIIINGQSWKGAHGIGGELGHTILDLERYCSATALIRMAREAVEKHPESAILSIAGGTVSNIEAKTVFDASKAGDTTAVEVYRRYISCLAQAVASVINLLDPEVIVLGGGVSKAGSYLLDPLVREIPQYVLFNDQPLPSVRIAVLGSEAGIIGASMLS